MATFNYDPYKPMPPNEPLVNAIQLSPAIKNHREFPEPVSACHSNSGDSIEDEEVHIKRDDGVDHIKKELQFDLNRPLKHALKSVFNHGGKVILAFPGSSILQLEEVAEDIRSAFEPAQRSWPPWLQIYGYGCNYRYPYVSIIDASSQRFPDVDVRVIQILTTSVDQYSNSIREKIQKTIRRDPDIDLVKLVNAETLTEALTVDPDKGNVHFKHVQPEHEQELDDTSLYFRVQFEPIASRDTKAVIILINLKTLLPIAKTENDELFAVLPQEPILSSKVLAEKNADDIPRTIAQPFFWLPAVVSGSSQESIYFYRQHGTDESSAIFPATEPGPTRRISKGRNNAAVIRVSDMRFVVRRIKTHTN